VVIKPLLLKGNIRYKKIKESWRAQEEANQGKNPPPCGAIACRSGFELEPFDRFPSLAARGCAVPHTPAAAW